MSAERAIGLSRAIAARALDLEEVAAAEGRPHLHRQPAERSRDPRD